MKVLMLCGSPHDEGGTSTYFLNGLKEKLDCETKIYNVIKSPELAEIEFIKAIKSNNNIVLSFPLYVDSLPAYFLKFLNQVEQASSGIVSQSKVYVIVNNGFYDAIQNHIAIRIVSKWCEKCGLTMGRTLAIGAGGMAQAAPIGNGPFANLGKAMTELAEDIKHNASGEIIYIEPKIPRFMYKISGNMGFKSQCRKNGLSRAEIKKG